MENIINTINNYSSLIIIALLTVTIVLVVITILLLNSVNKLERKYKKLMRGTNNKNLEELINSKLDEIDNSKVSAKEALEKYELLKNQMKKCGMKLLLLTWVKDHKLIIQHYKK